MRSIIETIDQLPMAENIRLMNELNKPLEQQDPSVRHLKPLVDAEMAQLHTKPASSLSPHMRQLQAMMQGLAPSVLLTGDVPGEHQKKIQAHYLVQRDELFSQVPELHALQNKIDAILTANKEKAFVDITVLANAVYKHLKGQEPFLMQQFCVPTKDEIFAQLDDLHSRKPAVHKQLLELMEQAPRHYKLTHPNGCTCPLCAHVTGVAGSRRQRAQRSS